MSTASNKVELFLSSHSLHKNCALRRPPEKFPATQKLRASSPAALDRSAPANSALAEFASRAPLARKLGPLLVGVVRLPFHPSEVAVAAVAAAQLLPKALAAPPVPFPTPARETLYIPLREKVPA